MARYYSAEEAAKRLGVSRNTLYAYVSRGLIRSEPSADSPRTRKYHAGDVDRLAGKHEVHKAPEAALRKTADWGAPVLESAITRIGDDDFFYRGHRVLELAAQGSFEKTAALLWEAPVAPFLRPETATSDAVASFLVSHRHEDLFSSFLCLLSHLNQKDAGALQFTREATIEAGRTMFSSFQRLMTGVLPEGPAAEHIATSWKTGADTVPLIDAALTLVADHELNISAFIARTAASAGCSPYASIAAATHAFYGRRHGGNTERIRGLLYEARGRGSLLDVVASRVRRGEPVPGFGHRLYNMDPRAKFLLERLPDSSGFAAQAHDAATGLLNSAYPTVDFALVLMEMELALPEKAATNLFYLGRLVGLVAHIQEQYERKRPIRFRAKYTGP